MAARLVVRALAPQGMGRALAPVGALPPYLPRGFFTLTHKKNTQEREEREQKNRVQETGNHTTKENHFPN